MPSSVKQDDELVSSRSGEGDSSKTGSSIEKKASKEESRKVKAEENSSDRLNTEIKQTESNEESVEVVLDAEGKSEIIEATPERPKATPKSTPDQNVFRKPQALKPRAMHAPGGPHPHPPPPPQYPHHYPHYPHYPYTHHGSGSWGYGPPPPPPPPPPHGEYPHHPPPPPPPPRAPYPVPYSASGSFDEQGSYHHHTTPHYSPHIQYPPPRYPHEDVNVISPNHKVNSPHKTPDPHYPPPQSTQSRARHLTPPQNYYHYPPTSPVSRPENPSSGPRLRNYAMRRGEGAYSRAQRGEKPREGEWSPYPPPPPPSSSKDSIGRTPVVAESFDSGHPRSSQPATPGRPPAPPSQPSDPHYHFYAGGGSWNSFDSAMGPPPPPPPYDEKRQYGYPPADSPYSPYATPYSPGALYRADSFPSPHPGYGPPPLPPTFSYSFDDDNARLLQDYNPDNDGEHLKHVTPPGNSKKTGRSKNATPVQSNTSADRNAVLPESAKEVDFDIHNPPLEPITPEGNEVICESLAEVNSYDVLCGRGGGTNSQIGNRRFRTLVQDFQPTYLLAKRKEKPLLARTIVLIIRKRGGRFLKKNEETGQLFEVGDTKAEAKTSQALREGLDVRATKSAQSLVEKAKKKKKINEKNNADEVNSVETPSPVKTSPVKNKEVTPRPPESPPTLPRLQGEEVKIGQIHPHSPDNMQFRKRRRVRSADRFFNDFCPPRAEINQAGCNPFNCGPGGDDDDDDDGVLEDDTATPVRRNPTRDEDFDSVPQRGCAGIALDIVTGAATGSFCLGPTGWRR